MPTHLTAWIRTGTEYGFEFNKELLLKGAGRAEDEQLIEIFKNQGLEPIDFKKVVDRKFQIFKELCAKEHPPAIKAVIAVINEGKRRGLPMAVVSGSVREMVVGALEAVGVKDNFAIILGREDYNKGKPDPEPFLLAAEKLGVAPEDCVGYEDAENAGMASIKAAGYLKAEFVKDFLDYPQL
mmetsp:Transcript_842/g.1322  ORF Transcript_842/g.1322 Transcript_842/m.1322 type:complete len:182 (-) Transcript_842:53-598(-)